MSLSRHNPTFGHRHSARLEGHFRQATAASRSSRPKVALELFDGTGRVGAAWRRSGIPVVGFDVKRGAEFDLTNPGVLKVILDWINCKRVVAVHIATPCSSFSRARRAPSWSKMPRKLRDDARPLGIQGLSAADAAVAKLGNTLSRRSAAIVQACIKMSVPGCEENPKNSYLWQVHGRPARARVLAVQSRVFDQCSFGALCRKSTRMDFWHVTPPLSFSACCRGRLCSFTSNKHLRLSGLSNGTFVTAHAAAYPEKLARAFAKTLAEASVGREAHNLWKNLSGIKVANSLGMV